MTIYFFIFSKQKYFQAIILWPQDFRARSELILVLFSKYQPFRVLMRAWFVVLQSQRQQNSMIWALLVEFPFNQKTTTLPLIGLWERSRSRNLAKDRLSNCIGNPVKPLSLKSRASSVSVKGSRLKSSKLRRFVEFFSWNIVDDPPNLKNIIT